ncbi:MAG: Ldh family oxidoreductase [Deltaproteobacteria bacterium]|nr:Ldh family oxidoreductase [Deltaproteobacteria bacterium]
MSTLLSHTLIRKFFLDILYRKNVREDVAQSLTHALLEASLHGIDSHGIRLFPHYLRGLEEGRLNPHPRYRFHKTSASTGLLDADHTLGHAAGFEAVKHILPIARESGAGHVCVFHSSHFGAAAPYARAIAEQDMIGFSFTTADALIKTPGSYKPFFGNNPICVAMPCEGEPPICLDMATSRVTFNKIKQFEEKNEQVPEGWGYDAQGNACHDPKKIVTLAPIGDYKGFGLSFMIEILCSVLSGMPFGPHIPKMFEAPMSEKRYLSQYYIAIRIDRFLPIPVFKERIARLAQEVRSLPRLQENIPICMPGDPEKKIYQQRIEQGIPLSAPLLKNFKTLGEWNQVEF